MNGAPTFLERLAKRQRVWWQKPRDYSDPTTYTDFLHQVSERHVLRRRSDADERWRCCRHWQRSLSNKWNAREFAIRHGIPVPELYWCGYRLSAVDFGDLPRHFVIRPTFGHSRHGVFVLCDGIDLLDGSKKTRRDVLRASAGGAKRLLSGPLLVEEFVGDTSPRPILPLEVDLHMFNEHIGAIQVVERSSVKGETRAAFYSSTWEPFPHPFNQFLPELNPVPAPIWLPELSAAAKRLGQAYGTYVRVDFRVAGDRIAFGEFATAPPLGWTAFADEYFGNLWQETFPEAL